MVVRKTKPAQASPNFEKLNQELLRRCETSTESARRVVENSKKITAEANQLIRRIRAKKGHG